MANDKERNEQWEELIIEHVDREGNPVESETEKIRGELEENAETRLKREDRSFSALIKIKLAAAWAWISSHASALGKKISALFSDLFMKIKAVFHKEASHTHTEKERLQRNTDKAEKAESDDPDDIKIAGPVPERRAEKETKKEIEHEPAPVMQKETEAEVSEQREMTEDEILEAEVREKLEKKWSRSPREKNNNRIIRRRREFSFGILNGLMYFMFIVAVSALLGAFGWMCASDMLGMKNVEDKNVIVSVPEKFTIDSVTDTLYEKGLIKYKFLFKLYAGVSNADTKIKSGEYELNTLLDYRAIVNSMKPKPKPKNEVKITFPEGYSMKQIFEELVKNNVCTMDELVEAATNYDFDYDFLDRTKVGDPHRLEGFLFPDTYRFYEGDTPENALSHFLDNFASKWTLTYSNRAAEIGYTMEQVLTIASIIEEEAGRDSERSTVSSVIHNRLTKNDFLQMDSTINYIIYGTDVPFSTEIDSPYNTYMYKGLPAGPISNPGRASIEAALYPQYTSYYYFALGKDNFTHFFVYYNDFINFRNSSQYAG